MKKKGLYRATEQEKVLFVVLAPLTLLLAIYFSSDAFLVFWYGYDVYVQESLTLNSPKGGEWTVSNGDIIPESGKVIRHMLGGFIWFGSLVPSYLIIGRFIPQGHYESKAIEETEDTEQGAVSNP